MVNASDQRFRSDNDKVWQGLHNCRSDSAVNSDVEQYLVSQNLSQCSTYWFVVCDNTLVWVDFSTLDSKEAKRFYTRGFGWEFHDTGKPTEIWEGFDANVSGTRNAELISVPSIPQYTSFTTFPKDQFFIRMLIKIVSDIQTVGFLFLFGWCRNIRRNIITKMISNAWIPTPCSAGTIVTIRISVAYGSFPFDVVIE